MLMTLVFFADQDISFGLSIFGIERVVDPKLGTPLHFIKPNDIFPEQPGHSWQILLSQNIDIVGIS